VLNIICVIHVFWGLLLIGLLLCTPFLEPVGGVSDLQRRGSYSTGCILYDALSGGMLRMSMELRGTCECLIRWLLGCELPEKCWELKCDDLGATRLPPVG
jgi:hypothetical protein